MRINRLLVALALLVAGIAPAQGQPVPKPTINNLAGPTPSAGLRSIITDPTGTGPAVFGTAPGIASPTFTGTIAGTPAWAASQAITLSTAAQPNITSVGTLTSLTVSGAFSYGGFTPPTFSTGTGAMVLANSPSLAGTIGGNLIFSGTMSVQGALTYGGVTFNNTVTGSGNLVGSASPTFSGIIGGSVTFSGATTFSGAMTLTSTSASAFSVGRLGATNPSFVVDDSAVSQAAGLKVTGAATGGTVTIAAIDSGSDTNLTINAKGAGTIGIGNVSTGAVTITPAVTHSGATTLSAALTYGGVTLSNAVTGTGNMVLSANATLSGTLTAAAANFSGAVSTAGLTTSDKITVTVAGDRNLLISKATTDTNNVVSLNNSLSPLLMVGLYGGATGNSTLGLNVPTGGVVDFNFNGSSAFYVSVTGHYPIANNTGALGDAGNKWATSNVTTATVGTLVVGSTTMTFPASGLIVGTTDTQTLSGKSLTSPTLTGTIVLTGSTITGAPTWSSNQAITLSTAAQPNVTSVGTLTGGATGAGFTVALGTSTISGILPAANFPALTGDITTSAGALATTLASVATAGTTGSSTAIPVITIDVKGRTTAITTAAVIAPAGTLTGVTLASNVLASSLTSLGILTGLTVTGSVAFSSGNVTMTNGTDKVVLISAYTGIAGNHHNVVSLNAAAGVTMSGMYGGATGTDGLFFNTVSGAGFWFGVNGTFNYFLNETESSPFADNVRTSGSGSHRWSNVYSVLGTFSGAVSMTALTATSATISGNATINGVQYGLYTTSASFGGDGSNVAIRSYASGGIYFQSSAGTTWGTFTSSGLNVVSALTATNGTLSGLLEVDMPSTVGTVNAIKLLNPRGVGGDGASIDFYAGAGPANKEARIYTYAVAANQGDLRLATANGTDFTDALTILGSNQYVGIGGAPSYLLDVLSNTNGDTAIRQYNASTGASATLTFQQNVGGRYVNRGVNYTSAYMQEAGVGITVRYSDFDTHYFRNNAFTVLATLDGSGLSIGTVSITTSLTLSGVSSTDSGKVTNTLCRRTGGSNETLIGSGTGGICAGTSTARAKDDWHRMQDGALQTIMQLNPGTYHYKPGWGFDPAKKYYGFLAEDIYRVIPEHVGLDEQGLPLNDDMLGKFPIMVKALQELKADNDNLRVELTALKRRAAQ